MSYKTEKQDKKLRAEGDDYVDPARYRGKGGHVKKKKRSGRLSPGSRKRALRDRAERNPAADTSDIALTYTDDEKFAIMYLCIRSTVKTVSLQEGIPDTTLYGWFRQVGGIDKVREFVASKAEASFYSLIDETAQEIRLRLSKAPNDELFETFRSMIDMASKTGMGRQRGGESGDSPGGAHPPIQMIFQGQPPALDVSSSSSPPKAKDKQDDDEEVDGEVVSVFDD